MEKIDIINNFVKMLLISLFIYLTYEKITNYKKKNINYIIIFFVSTIISIVYIILNKYLPALLMAIVLYMLYAFIIDIIIGNKINYVAYIYSCVITYAIYLTSVLIAGLILIPIVNNSQYGHPISLVTIQMVFTLLFLFIFTRKRFKNGINFLNNKKVNRKIEIFAILTIAIISVMFCFPQKVNALFLKICFFICSACIVFYLIIWIKTQITSTYKNKMRDRTIEIQKAEIDEQTKIIEEIKEENLKLATAIHKYNKKFSALEFAMKNTLEMETNTEFANELAVILEETKEASKNFAKETEVNTNKLVLTNIPGIDNMFKYMQEEARKKDINFDLKLNASINSLIENVISKDKLETLIGDHLKDAIIAVDASNESYKSILVTLGLVDGIYELSIHDTGIEFEIDTLLKLGKEQVTTHKEEGGSGIGFMTTFDTLKECKASLVIEEYNPETTNYTKSVTIRFDGKNEYKIISYRAEKIKEQKHERRIIIEKLK